MKTMPSVSCRVEGSGPHPAGAHDHEAPWLGQRGAHPAERSYEAVHVLAGFERAHGQEELARHPDAGQQCVGGHRVRVRQVVRPAGHDGDPGRVDAGGGHVRGDEPGGHDDVRAAVAGAEQRGLVPPAPAPGRGFGIATPGHVVDGDDEAAPARPPQWRCRQRDRVHDVEPLGCVPQAVVPGPRQERARQPRGPHRQAEGRQRVVRRLTAPARCPAGQEGEGDRVAFTGGQPAQKAARVRADAAGHLPAELLHRHEHRGRRALRHRRRLRRRGRAPRGPRRNDPTRTGRTRRGPPRAAWRAASRPRRTRPVPPRARRGRPHPP